MNDNVNHPTHYLLAAVTIEPIELTARMTSCIGQALQYVFRAKFKENETEDLKKAVFYLKKQLEVGGYSDVYPEAFPYITIFSEHSTGLIKKVIDAIFAKFYSEDDTIGYVVDREGLKAAIEIIEGAIRDLESWLSPAPIEVSKDENL